MICGVDEVGRGALAGPLMAVAAAFECVDAPMEGLKDSKKFSSKSARKKVFKKLLACEELLDFGVGQIGAHEIDEKGITWANNQAMKNAVSGLMVFPDTLIIDGVNRIQGLVAGELWGKGSTDFKQIVEPKAEDKYWQVAAASILAKVIRDDYMEELGILTGFSCWSTCSGYGTKAHTEAIKALGITEYHRKTFVKVSG